MGGRIRTAPVLVDHTNWCGRIARAGRSEQGKNARIADLWRADAGAPQEVHGLAAAERVFLPDAAITTDYLLHLTAGLVENLVVDADRMRANLESTGGLIYTSSVLLELVEGGLSREDAYAFVQRAAMRTWETGTLFRETLTAEQRYDDRVLLGVRLSAGLPHAELREEGRPGRAGRQSGYSESARQGRTAGGFRFALAPRAPGSRPTRTPRPSTFRDRAGP